MMDKITVVGSGASGVHFALSLLRKGYHVIMLDVGNSSSERVHPDDSFIDLKRNLTDPVSYFLGDDFQAVVYPDFESEYYGFPPSKDYVFMDGSNNKVKAKGFSPLFSFAQGGLAEAWTGGAYPFNEDDLRKFPFTYKDIAPYYEEVSDRIGIIGEKDDLHEILPYHKNLMTGLDLEEHSQLLLEAYRKNKKNLNKKLSFLLGRSRTAVLSKDKGHRKKCNYDGRCLWGCPSEALYTPSITLRECMAYSSFKYVGDAYVSHFKYNTANRVTSVVTRSLKRKEEDEIRVDQLVLAAGTLSSSRIFLNSIYFDSGELIRLEGLMDNRQIMAPFINVKMIGKDYNPNSYQYHQIAMALKGKNDPNYIHGLITTLKTALFHPIIQSVPLDMKTSIFIFRNVHAALGVANINLPDRRRMSNYLQLEPATESGIPELIIHYTPGKNEKKLIKKTMRNFNKAFRKLGCFVPPGMAHIRPMGSSVHYAGTIPMSASKDSYTASAFCRSHDFENLFFVDGATFPDLPAKNLTFTMMANAVRVAETVF